MTSPCTVLIGAGSLLESLKDRIGRTPGDVLLFADVDALTALDAILTRLPTTIAVERAFAATARGAALVHRIKIDPTLSECDVRVVSPDGTPVHLTGGRVPDGGAAAPVTAASLDPHGTRRARRYKMPGPLDALLNNDRDDRGDRSTLIDLSICGAQLLSPTALKPGQRVRIALTDDRGVVRVTAIVVWASFEIAAEAKPRYRAGVDFTGADTTAVEAYLQRHLG